ncbi:gamma-glutamylputrescine oxidoreductase [bacterium BMS3Bbin10]|nr:gamma-glutamylputrescine oxidoreductase [bacterium BMS3Bbin10]HDL17148.1 FAD-binding oxidoreductase [Hyphomicrobiales bacterium]
MSICDPGSTRINPAQGKAYDPLTADGPGRGRPHALSYWAATAGEEPPHDGSLTGDREVDIAIVGAGYTGLAAALHLACEYNLSIAVLEANRIGWGCSGRNGSFARVAFGRLGKQEWIDRYGINQARLMLDEARQGLNHLRSLIEVHNIDCDLTEGGSLEVAHRPRHARRLEELHRLLEESFDYRTELLDSTAIADRHYRGSEIHAGLFDSRSFGVHPLKLAHGLARAARDAGAALHVGSPALAIRRDGPHRVLETPGGRLIARTVIIATNGYTGERLVPQLKGRTMPVLSNIVVTRAMTAAEKTASNFVSDALIHDTRKLRSYYRRLPDNRILMGGRGPITESPAEMAAQTEHLTATIGNIWPALSGITADYAWGGWVNMTRDSLPHLYWLEDDPAVIVAMGYNGTGVPYSIAAGRHAAQLAVTARCEAPGPLLAPLERFMMSAFRRLGQRALYKLWGYQDGR